MEEQGLLSNVKKIIHSLVVSTPLRMTVEGLRRDYKTEEGCPLPYQKFGFKDIESFLRSIPDTVLVTGCGPMAEVIAKTTEKSAHIQKMVKCQKKPSLNARNRRGRKPMFVYPSERSDLVFVNEQRAPRRRNYSYRQPQQSYGHRSPPRNSSNGQHFRQEQRETVNTNSMINSFAKFKILNVDEESSSDEFDNFECLPVTKNEMPSNSTVQLNNNGNSTAKQRVVKSPIPYVSSDEGSDEDAIPISAVDERVLNYKYSNNKHTVKQEKKSPVIECLSSDNGSDTEAIPAYAVDERVLSVEYPRDAVRFNQQLAPRDIKRKIKLDSRIQVQLVTVASPHSFYFWLHDEQYDDYKAMSTNMQNFYDNIVYKSYALPMYLIIPGHLAACRNIIWQRVKVLTIKTGSKQNIEVEHIDTGERKWVSHSQLKYLCKEFATLPAQCWYGRLSCVMPLKGIHFSMEASNYFYDLISYRRLYAKVEAIDSVHNAVHMILVDPDAVAYTKNINIALIESGLVRRSYKP